jgi:hypothetical protein
VIVPTEQITFDDAPNLELVEIRVNDDTRTRSIAILSESEFSLPRENQDPWPSEQGYSELEAQVCARVRQANQDLSSRDWRPLESCAITDVGNSVFPPCSFAAQRIVCGESSIIYRRPRLTIRSGGRSRTLGRANWMPKPLVDASWPNPIPVRECFTGVWHAPAQNVFVGVLANACQQGGDWCIVQSSWHAIRP